MGDAGMTIQRAQDKIAAMQARAGAIDELLASGALTDLSSNTDDIQAQLNKVAATAQVDTELAALKSELAPAPDDAGLPTGPPAVEAPSTSPPGPSGQTTHQPEVTI
jgi:phage shock protein A